jgi:uncharacterized protein (AIM24 family)
MSPYEKISKTDDPDEVLHASGWDYLQKPHVSGFHYAIAGHESQVITLQLLREGDAVKAEPGTMMYLSHGIQQSIACEGCCARCCSGEACWVSVYTNPSNNTSYVALTPSFPTSKVIPVDLSSPHVNGVLICQQGSYMASFGEVLIDMSCDCNFVRCCCGGMGLVRQRLQGSGTAFLSSTGTIVQKVLATGETILVDTQCVLAFAGSCKMDLRRTGGVLVRVYLYIAYPL